MRVTASNLESDDARGLVGRSVRKPPSGKFPNDVLHTDIFGGTRRGVDARHQTGYVAGKVEGPVVLGSSGGHYLSLAFLVGCPIAHGEFGVCRRVSCGERDSGNACRHRPLRAPTPSTTQLRRIHDLPAVFVLRETDGGIGNLRPSRRGILDGGNCRVARACLAGSTRARRLPPRAIAWCDSRLVLSFRSTFGVDDHCYRGSTIHDGGVGLEAFVARFFDSVRPVHDLRDVGGSRSGRDSWMSSRPSITQLKNGDSDAWAWFFDEFSGPIAGYARRMGVSDPDDVTGTVLETVARSVGNFSGSHSQFRSWVFSIAHARIVDDHRRRDRRPEVEFTESHDRTQAGADTLVVSGDPELEAAMNQLTEEQRSMLHLRFVLELSTKEIARVTDKSEVATRVALHRCSKRLRELLSGGDLEMAVES